MTFREALQAATLRALAIDDAKHPGHPLPAREGFDWWSEPFIESPDRFDDYYDSGYSYYLIGKD